MGDQANPVQWPGNAYLENGDDLGVPIVNMIERLRNMGAPDSGNDDGDNGKVSLGKGTPYSLQVITAGASSFSKWWSSFVGSLGGISVLAAAISGFYTGEDAAVRAVIIGSAAVIAAAAFLAVATIVRADVMARGTASAARKQATATVAAAMFETYRYSAVPREPARPTYSPVYAIKTGSSSGWKQVKTFGWDDDQNRFVARVVSGNEVPVDEITSMVDLTDVLDELRVPKPA